MEYTVSKGAPGKRQVSFSCPACQDRLKTPLESAGQEVECPTCGHLLLIPGSAELQAQQAEQAAAEQAAEPVRQKQPTPSSAPAAGVMAATASLPLRASPPAVFSTRPGEAAIPQYRGLLTAKSVFWILAMLCYLMATIGFVAGTCLLVYQYSPSHAGEHGDFAKSLLVENIVLLVGGVIGTAFYGFVLQVVGELVGAFRDIAINSFKK